MFYGDIFATLNKAEVRYLVVGGVAVALHGAVRFTHDLDLFVDLEEGNLLRFIHILKQKKLSPKIPAKPEDFAKKELRDIWIKEKNMKVFSFRDAEDETKTIDVFVYEPIDFKEAYSRRIIVKSHGINVPIISKEDLIKLKEISGRMQDIEDIGALKKLR